MHIDHIATRIIDRNDHHPGDVNLAHPYRRRWWLPIIGPTATLLLDHLTEHDTDTWTVHDTTDLATRLGLGRGTGLHSPLLRTLDRLTYFGLGTFDIAPGDPDADPCITLWATVRLVPERFTRTWPDTLQHAHAIDLAALHRAAA